METSADIASRKRPNEDDLGGPHKKPHTESETTAGLMIEGSQREDGEDGKLRAVETPVDENVRKSSRSKEGKSISLSEAWKEDGDVGPMLASLVDLFGEGMLPFIPSRELSIFF